MSEEKRVKRTAPINEDEQNPFPPGGHHVELPPGVEKLLRPVHEIASQIMQYQAAKVIDLIKLMITISVALIAALAAMKDSFIGGAPVVLVKLVIVLLMISVVLGFLALNRYTGLLTDRWNTYNDKGHVPGPYSSKWNIDDGWKIYGFFRDEKCQVYFRLQIWTFLVPILFVGGAAVIL